MTDRQYRLVNTTTQWADPNLIHSRQHAIDQADAKNRQGSDRWIVQFRVVDEAGNYPPGEWAPDPAYVVEDAGARATARARAAMLDVATAFKAAGRTRKEADESLTLTCHADYVGLLNGVLDEAFPADPVLDLPSYSDSDLQTVMVIAAARVIAADFRARAANIRPDVDPDSGSWDRDDEEADSMADAYDECARDLLAAFGLREEV
jgi:hypothetical protein